MSTWIQLHEAHRIAALNAYGYSDVSARVPNMSADFARVFLDSWVKIGQASDDVVTETDGGAITTPGPLGAATPFLQNSLAALNNDYSLVPQTGFVAAPGTIWNDAFAMASVMDGGFVAGPSYIESVKETVGDAASYVDRTARSAANALSKPLSITALIVVLVLGSFIILEVK